MPDLQGKSPRAKKSGRGARYAAPLTVKSQLVGKLGNECFGQLLDRLHRAARPKRARRPRRKVAA